jgi:DNA (cytosine-5)-methyltransferase 1
MASKSISKQFKYIDLFAGIGGFAAAMEALGGQAEYSVDIDSRAAAIYERNWGHSSLGDITRDANDSTMNVKAHDVLLAGFPCQPFSKSGAQRGMDETRGTLYWNILNIIKKHHPTIVLLENVRNLTGPRHKHEWRVIIETLRDEGYSVSFEPSIISPHLIPPSMGGRPQVRERVFIAGVYTGKPVSHDLQIDPLISRRDLLKLNEDFEWNLERDLPLDSTSPVTSQLTKLEKDWLEAWNVWVKEYKKHNKTQPPGFPIWVDAWVNESKLRIPIGTPDWKSNFLRKNAGLYTANKTWIDEWLKNYKVQSFPDSRRKLEWQAQDEKNLATCLIQFRPSGIRAKKQTYVPALVAINQTSIIGNSKDIRKSRKITVREAARLQGLPDWFDLSEQPESASYKQLGNAVNVGAVWNALKFLAVRDREHLESSKRGQQLLNLIETAPSSPDKILKNMKRG